MSGKGFVIAIKIAKVILPIIKETLEAVEEARDPQSHGGEKITKKEAIEIAEEISLAAVPELHDAILKLIKKEI
jgi:hypothetical protein